MLTPVQPPHCGLVMTWPPPGEQLLTWWHVLPSGMLYTNSRSICSLTEISQCSMENCLPASQEIDGLDLTGATAHLDWPPVRLPRDSRSLLPLTFLQDQSPPKLKLP